MRAADVARGSFIDVVAPITATDDEIRSHLATAAIPPLLPALAYATGDLSLLRQELRPDPTLLRTSQAGLSSDQQARVRDLAFEALVRFRDNGSRVEPPPTEEELLRIIGHAVGETDASMTPYLPLVEEELSFRGEDRRAPAWRLEDIAPGRALRVAVIGAGLSGIALAYRLRQAGLAAVVFEKNDDVGGTWLENTYPGCRVDNPSHNYSYSFAQRHDWPLHFSTQKVLLEYLRACADLLGVRELIQFRSEVRSAKWSEPDQAWVLEVRTPHYDTKCEFDAVVSAVGQLNRPSFPDIEGRDTFAGPSFHSAEWRHDIDLSGKRVAVIGTGASAVQFIPEIAPVVEELLVFQRNAPWLAPSPEYHEQVSDGLRWLYSHVPAYSELNRFLMFWQTGDSGLAAARVDPDWDGHGRSTSAANDYLRKVLTRYLHEQFAGRPDLLHDVIPTYPPMAKRLLRDNGVWAGAITRDNVRLIADRIARITPSGIESAHGTAHDVDVIIYGTGFRATEFLSPIRVIGRGGADLHRHWDGVARAYLGITVPGFPNLFCLYGPNTNIVANGSIVFFSECGSRYILGCLELLARTGSRSLEVRRDVHDRFNETVEAANHLMAWGHSDVTSWYKTADGHVTQNWPFTMLEYWQRTLAPEPGDFRLR
ncbi:MAG TPA: NAD(P)-binding protein [Acidimicrobiales bacterium]|nr:NAD(P)-binding protein [Acidimicrobiales bacterium]